MPERSEFQQRIGVGERQPRDGVVADGTRTHRRTVINDTTGRAGGEQIEHRSGRVDAIVTPETTGLSARAKEM